MYNLPVALQSAALGLLQLAAMSQLLCLEGSISLDHIGIVLLCADPLKLFSWLEGLDEFHIISFFFIIENKILSVHEYSLVTQNNF